jgi:hypothetical protein
MIDLLARREKSRRTRVAGAGSGKARLIESRGPESPSQGLKSVRVPTFPSSCPDFSLIVEPAAGRMHVTRGNPGDMPYEVYRLD